MFGPPNTATHLNQMAQLNKEHDARVTELLKANNREVERRRAAEAEVAELKEEIQQMHWDAAGEDI